MAKSILTNPVEVNIAISKPNEAIDQSAYVCYETQKLGIVRELFREAPDFKSLIFSSSKQKVKELAHTLKRMHLDVAPMHSDLDQPKREEVMLNYKNGKVKILVATDIVARGIDIEDIALVINYDVPHDPEDYIHRIGRTARAAATGAAITFVNEEEQSKFYLIEKFIEREVRKRELPEGMEGPAYKPSDGRKGDGRGRKGRGSKSRSGKGRGGRGKERANTSAETVAAEAPQTDNNHGEGRGEGNRGTRDRKRRRRGGRNHRKPNTNQTTQGDATKEA